MEEKKSIEIVSDGTRLMSYQEHERIRKNQRIGIALAVILVVAGLFAGYWNRTFYDYEEMSYTKNTEGNEIHYAVFLNGYLKYSKDGISYLDRRENILWTSAYTMSKPHIAVKDSYAAVADLEGNAVHIYDVNGKVGEYSMSYPIKKIMVAKQGVFCVVLDGDDGNYIRLYDSEGSLLAEIKTKIENNGYPMAVALSEDASRLAASFFRVDGIDSQNILSFYNFGEGGKGQSGNLVGTYQLDNLLIPKIMFTDSTTVIAVGDSKMLVYDVEGKPEQIREIAYPSEIINVFGDEDYIGYTCENPIELVEAGEASPYELYIYNSKGRQLRTFGVDKLYANVEMIDNVIIGYTGTECAMIRTNGTEVFIGDMGRNITDVLPGGSSTEFLFVYSDSCSRIRLQTQMNGTGQTTEEMEITE